MKIYEGDILCDGRTSILHSASQGLERNECCIFVNATSIFLERYGDILRNKAPAFVLQREKPFKRFYPSILKIDGCNVSILKD